MGQLSQAFDLDYIATLPNGIKITLSYKNYGHYKFRIGQRLFGKIDKINCSGKIYFEPDHPFYIVGKRSGFEVVEISTEQLPNGIVENRVVVQDRFKQNIELVCHKQYSKGQKASLLVQDIHKGRPILSDPDVETTNHIVLLNVVKSIFMEGVEHYALENQQGERYYIPSQWYPFHKLAIGNQINGYFWYSSTNQTYRVEPFHPLYSEGDIVELKSMVNDGELWAIDGFGQAIKVQGGVVDPSKTATIRCEVLRIRKGVPILKLIV